MLLIKSRLQADVGRPGGGGEGSSAGGYGGVLGAVLGIVRREGPAAFFKARW
jgi:hypothetical protein